jgi:hypothetical protein
MMTIEIFGKEFLAAHFFLIYDFLILKPVS